MLNRATAKTGGSMKKKKKGGAAIKGRSKGF